MKPLKDYTFEELLALGFCIITVLVFAIGLLFFNDGPKGESDYDAVIRMRADRYKYEAEQERIQQQIETDARIRQITNP